MNKGANEWNRLPIRPGLITGVFAATNNFGAHDVDGGWNGSDRSGGFDFDASRVSSVYDSGTTVRPAAVYTNWCVKF